ncbi:hypothetical protein [Pedobacter frigidisoli]|uniref:GAP1-N1 domain-containing protein n=1 Tax=Pedobacter frigidisoli TaxID=2530455 RepID=UPI00293055D3|nr:hypothetical protein [Pedobacter frigidisoli]
MVENNIKVQQTIHGYKEGHTLLSSSLDLTIGERKELQLLSDYSGTGIESSFSEYITGYPLSNSKYYALAKTWYASEMPRPGCVWTHTLLIEISAIWTIKNFELLLGAFKRPAKEMVNKKIEPIEFSISELSNRKLRPTPRQYAVSCSLYSNDKPLIIYSNAETEFQKDILTIWTYQWPRLKRNFSFCTGSIALRSIGKEFFDLQVMPENRERMLTRLDKEKFSFYVSGTKGCNDEILDLYKNQDPEVVLDFMTKFGSDLLPNKENFSLLLRAYAAMNNINSQEYVKIMQLLVRDLPLPSEGKLLKSNLVQLLFNLSPKNNFSLITSLLTENAFSELNWDFALVIFTSWTGKNLSEVQVLKLLELLKDSETNRPDFIRLLTTLPSNVWISRPTLYKAVLNDILTQNGELIYKELIWKSEDIVQDLWWSKITRIKNPKWPKIIDNMLEAENGRFSEEIFSILGDRVFEPIFQWLNRDNKILPLDWEYLIKQKPSSAFKSLSILNKYNNSQLSIIPKVLSPTEGAWFEVSDSDFERFFKKVQTIGDLQTQTSLYTFFTTTAFSNSVVHPEILSELIFQPLHNNLKGSIFDFHTWNRFKMLMGRDLYDMIELDFFSKLFKERNEVPEWDHCEFLRRSLISCFLKYKWDPYYIVQIVKDEHTFKKIVEFGVDVKPVKKILKQARQKLEENRLEKTFYYKILDKNL